MSLGHVVYLVHTCGDKAHGFIKGGIMLLRFRYLMFSATSNYIKRNDTLILSAFNLKTKQDGFFRLNLGNGELKKMTLSPRLYMYQIDDFCGAHFPGPVVKAKQTDIYVLPIMSSTEYPNLYITRDFGNFKQLTFFEPQKEYNWYHSELEHWKLPDGKPGVGILYKPENFDPRKKYPVIFYYYQKNAFNLNIFIHPDLTIGTMSIPWFVSNGYLVFVPDIDYKIGHPGRSGYNAIVSAAQYLAKKIGWIH